MSDFAFVPDSLLEFYEDAKITQYSHLAAGCIIAFDHLITLDVEVNFIWMGTWSLSKVLFLMNRYYILAAMIFNSYVLFVRTHNNLLYVLPPAIPWAYYHCNIIFLFFTSCHIFFQWQGLTALLVTTMTQGILQIRIYAIYLQNKRILAAMLGCSIASLVTSTWIMGRELSAFTAQAVSVPGGKQCVPKSLMPHFYRFWIPTLCFESFLCSLALIRGLQMFKSIGSLTLYQNGRRLVEILLRDSILYFLAIGATYFTCLVFWLLGPIGFLEIPVGFAMAFPCVLANRMLLNIRSISREVVINNSDEPEFTTLDPRTISTYHHQFSRDAWTS
ncbi:hypothetical protein GALMADRAFT_1161980 [Galerina marginata CBS 339.88]|uniref:DUF6533 domain-containing protein n=1 Tax=Galerina marginata (strain CBS 339.88) TaxID=685588 RepID=A0A067SEV4_GALM3|nr:hypothetical protein GALMADRAFT_1161980 [Galerina marginata CBS 339.88]